MGARSGVCAGGWACVSREIYSTREGEKGELEDTMGSLCLGVRKPIGWKLMVSWQVFDYPSGTSSIVRTGF